MKKKSLWRLKQLLNRIKWEKSSYWYFIRVLLESNFYKIVFRLSADFRRHEWTGMFVILKSTTKMLESGGLNWKVDKENSTQNLFSKKVWHKLISSSSIPTFTILPYHISQSRLDYLPLFPLFIFFSFEKEHVFYKHTGVDEAVRSFNKPWWKLLYMVFTSINAEKI